MTAPPTLALSALRLCLGWGVPRLRGGRRRAGALAVVVVCLAPAPTGLPVGEAAPRAAPPATQAPTVTIHPPLPTTAADAWLVPDPDDPPPPASVRTLATAVARVADGRYAEALPQLAQPRLADSPVSGYAAYYSGRALLGLGRPAEARNTLEGLRARPLEGALTELVPQALAEALAAAGEPGRAAAVYEDALARQPREPEALLERLAAAATAAGDTARADAALTRLYFEFPVSEAAGRAADRVNALRATLTPERAADWAKLDLARAEGLFSARRYADAREAYLAIAPGRGTERELVELRLAETDYFLRRHRDALVRLEPLLGGGSRRAEAEFYYLSALRGLRRHDEFVLRARRLAEDAAGTYWGQEALNTLATHYIVENDDAAAADVFRLIVERFPGGRHFERAAWKLGWWHYKNGELGVAASVFERAAVAQPRADFRPAWLYWSARAREQLSDAAGARAGYELVAHDYRHSYYGRLAAERLERHEAAGRPAQARAPRRPREAADAQGAGGRRLTARAPAQAGAGSAGLPPTHALIRQLIAVGLYDDALNELLFAQRAWGSSPRLEATLAYVHNRLGDYRRGIILMKRAYPQYLAADGDQLPLPLRQVIFPLAYWDLIRRHAGAHELDEYLVAALVAQESSFQPDVRSSANAYGLMQIVPSTGRRLARAEGIRRFRTSMLTDPRINVRLGTRYLAGLLARFGADHFALASYNAGESRIVRWRAERPGVARDEFIDDIPFPETQNYVKKILGTVDDYRQVYGVHGAAPDPVLPAATRSGGSQKPSVGAAEPRAARKLTTRKTSRRASAPRKAAAPKRKPQRASAGRRAAPRGVPRRSRASAP